MTTTDDRVRRALRQVAHDAAEQADTDRAMGAVVRRRPRIPTGLWLGMAAAVAAGAVAIVMWPEDRNKVVTTDVTSTAPTAPPNPTIGSSVAAPTSVVPTTVAPTTSVPGAATSPGDPLGPGVVDFTGIGQLQLDKTLDAFPGWTTSFDLGPSCGNLTPNATLWDVVQGRVTADERGVLRVDAVYTYDPRYRTTEGMGVGSTIDELRATYGERLKEAAPAFLPDGRPAISDPPYAHYGPLASVFDGDRAITFWLGGRAGTGVGQIVSAVKVSHLDFAGDDEGCA